MNARLYARIMKHLEKTTGTSSWDFRTLNQAHPQLAGYLFGILANVMGDKASDIVILNHYAPSRLWAWDLTHYQCRACGMMFSRPVEFHWDDDTTEQIADALGLR